MQHCTEKSFVLVYVIDLLSLGIGPAVKYTKTELSMLFTVIDLNECKNFLEIKINSTPNGTYLTKSPCTNQLMQQTGMKNAKPIKTTLPLSHHLYDKVQPVSEEESTAMSKLLYREVLSFLLYLLTRTRPDIATAVSMLSKFQANSALHRWRVMKNVLRYLKGSTDYGIFIPKVDQTVSCYGYTDANLARDHSNRKIRNWYCSVFQHYSSNLDI